MFKDTKAFGGYSVDDIAAAKRFYGEVLGIELEEHEMGIVTLQLAGGERPTILYPKPDHEAATFTVLNFPVGDVAGTVAALRERGVAFERYAGTPVETDDDFVFRGGGPEIALGAGGFLLARCAGQDKYFTVLDEIFHQQDDIYRSGDIKGGLLKIAKANGMSDQQFSDCINNNEALVALNTRSEKAGKDGVEATPTFFVNGRKAFEAVPSEAQLEAAIAGAS